MDTVEDVDYYDDACRADAIAYGKELVKAGVPEALATLLITTPTSYLVH